MIITAGDAKTGAAVAAAAEIAFDLAPRTQYRLTARGGDLWFRITTAGGAAAAIAGDGSHFLPSGTSVPIAAIGSENVATQFRNRVSVIRNTTDCHGVISEVPPVQGY